MDKSQLRFLKMAAPLGGLFLARYIDDKDASQMMLVRTTWGIFVAMTFAALFWVRQEIVKANNTAKIRVPQKAPFGAPAGETTYKDMTVVEYELSEWKATLSNLGFGAAFILGLHLYFGLVPPILINTLQTPIGLISSPLFNIYVAGKADTARPFAPEEGMFDSLKSEWKQLKKVVKEGVPDEDGGDDKKSPTSNPKAEKRMALLKERKEAKKNK